MPKYSIIIPAYNGMPYLKYCVESVVSQNYDDYELIISEDHSTDGTAEYIDSLNCYNKVKIFHCPVKMSMSEHWEYAQSFASGDWQIFVGQDDGLQGYFFELADFLTGECEKKRINVIMSERAYFFWPGTEDTYGNKMILYNAQNYYKILQTRYEMENALYRRRISYMDFPSMYTTSIFSKKFIDEIKIKQGGKFFTTHPQDANLSALVACLTKRYLKSYIPLGWVGSSVKSAGLAVSKKKNAALREDYLNKVETSKFNTHVLSGDFRLCSHPAYFWGALLVVSEKLNKSVYRRILKYNVRQKIFRNVLEDITADNSAYFEKLLEINNISFSVLTNRNSIFFKIKEKFLFYLHFKFRRNRRIKKFHNYNYEALHGSFDYNLKILNDFILGRVMGSN